MRLNQSAISHTRPSTNALANAVHGANENFIFSTKLDVTNFSANDIAGVMTTLPLALLWAVNNRQIPMTHCILNRIRLTADEIDEYIYHIIINIRGVEQCRLLSIFLEYCVLYRVTFDLYNAFRYCILIHQDLDVVSTIMERCKTVFDFRRAVAADNFALIKKAMRIPECKGIALNLINKYDIDLTTVM